MFEIDYQWTSTGSSGGATNLTPVELRAGASYSALFVQTSTLASTQSFSFQTAQSSAGPWYTENSTSIGADANNTAQGVIRVTGPYKWMRPRLNSASTGTYTLRLIAVG